MVWKCKSSESQNFPRGAKIQIANLLPKIQSLPTNLAILIPLARYTVTGPDFLHAAIFHVWGNYTIDNIYIYVKHVHVLKRKIYLSHKRGPWECACGKNVQLSATKKFLTSFFDAQRKWFLFAAVPMRNEGKENSMLFFLRIQ